MTLSPFHLRVLNGNGAHETESLWTEPLRERCLLVPNALYLHSFKARAPVLQEHVSDVSIE